MNFRNNKGITGTDISVSLIIIVLFVGIISTLVYNFSAESKEINRKSQAIDIAISKIESMKQSNYDEIVDGIEFFDKNGQSLGVASGPFEAITTVTKYKDSEYLEGMSSEEKNKIQDLIKIVKVSVKYYNGGSDQTIELSTVITKED